MCRDSASTRNLNHKELENKHGEQKNACSKINDTVQWNSDDERSDDGEAGITYMRRAQIISRWGIDIKEEEGAEEQKNVYLRERSKEENEESYTQKGTT